MFTHLNIKNKFFALFTIKFIFVAAVFVTQINGSEYPVDPNQNEEEVKISAEDQSAQLEQSKKQLLPYQSRKHQASFDLLIKSLAENSLVGAISLTLMQPFLKSLREKLEPLQESHPDAIFYGSGTLISLVIGGAAYKLYQAEKINNLQLKKLEYDTKFAKIQVAIAEGQRLEVLGRAAQGQGITSDSDLEGNSLNFEQIKEKLNNNTRITRTEKVATIVTRGVDEEFESTIEKLKKRENKNNNETKSFSS